MTSAVSYYEAIAGTITPFSRTTAYNVVEEYTMPH